MTPPCDHLCVCSVMITVCMAAVHVWITRECMDLCQHGTWHGALQSSGSPNASLNVSHAWQYNVPLMQYVSSTDSHDSSRMYRVRALAQNRSYSPCCRQYSSTHAVVQKCTAVQFMQAARCSRESKHDACHILRARSAGSAVRKRSCHSVRQHNTSSHKRDVPAGSTS